MQTTAQTTAQTTVTYITFFFDLYRRDQAKTRLGSLEKYQKNWSHILSLDDPLVIFCESDYLEEFRKLRKTKPTIYYPLKYEELTYYRYYYLLEAHRKKNPIKNAHPTKDTIDYTVLILSKQWFISEVLRKNPFSSTHFVLVDIGITHIAKPSPWPEITQKIQSLDRVRVCCMRYASKDEIRNRTLYYSAFRGCICAGIIAGPHSKLAEFCQSYVSEFFKVLSLSMAPSDEQLLGLLVTEQPNLFDVYYGDYCDILVNFVELRSNPAMIIFALRKAVDREHGLKIISVIGETSEKRPGFFNEVQQREYQLLKLRFVN